jgi:hypothetical protein
VCGSDESTDMPSLVVPTAKFLVPTALQKDLFSTPVMVLNETFESDIDP